MYLDISASSNQTASSEVGPRVGGGGEVKHLKRRCVSPFSVKDRDHLQILSVVHKYISKPEIVAINLNGPWSYLLSTK